MLGSFLVGERPLDQLWTNVGEPAVVVFAAITVGIFVVAFRHAGRRNQTAAAVMLVYAVLVYVVPTWSRGTAVIGFGIGRYTLDMTRYTLAPILLLLSSVAVLVDGVGIERDRPGAELGRKILVVQICIVIVIGFITPTVRSDGPGWVGESARVYAAECKGQPPDKVVEVTTSPTNFRLALRCDRLQP